MKPPAAEWRTWLYAALHAASAPIMLAFVIWLMVPVRHGCPAGHERFCLEISDRAILGGLVIVGLVVAGFVIRSAIRNLKGSAAGISFEAESHQEEPPK